MSRLVILGYGYTAARLADVVLARGWRVSATTRNSDKRAQMRAKSIQAFTLPETNDEWATLLDGATHILHSIQPMVVEPAADAIAAVVKKANSLQWFGYLSTTGVYGDKAGAWVDENIAVQPSGERAQKRVEAEQCWLHSGLPAQIFRLAGIYGPGEGRNVLDRVQKNTLRTIDKPGQVFSRIHVDDIVQVLLASMERGQVGDIYNVADDEPASPVDVHDYACKLLGVAPPAPIPYADAAPEMSAMARSFYEDNRRVSNAKIKAKLGVELAHPTYREGLTSLLSS